jgi:D-alanyl-D-alanine carboxypeptidase
LSKLVEEKKTPSVQYVIFNTNSIIHKYQNGFSEILNHQKITENTTYNVYSITKTFTALSVLQLAQQRKIDIEHAAQKYLHDFPYSPEITIRQLLTHAAGIPNPIPISWIHLQDEHEYFDRDKFFSQIFRKNNKTLSRPNEKFSYSNLGYVLLGQLIEKVSGLSFEDYVRTYIIRPLNLEPNELDFTIADTHKHAKGYQKKYSLLNGFLGFFLDRAKFVYRTEGKWVSFRNSYVNGAYYGGLIGSANAITKYLQEFLKPDSILINNELKKILFTENYSNTNKPTGMCMSWFVGFLEGNRYYAHAGGGGGYYSEIRLYPELGIGSVVLFNRTGISDERFLDKLDRFILE